MFDIVHLLLLGWDRRRWPRATQDGREAPELQSTGSNTRRVRLDGWKDVAAYLRRSRRTVQRWHSVGGLPVHHVFGPKGVVFAYSDELDHWMQVQRRSPAADFSPDHQDDIEPSDAHLHSLAVPDRTSRHGSAIGIHCEKPADSIKRASFIWQVLSERNVGTLTRLFGEHLESDPTNAPALAGLAHSLMMQGVLGLVGLAEVYATASAAAQMAIELQPKLGEARSATAWLHLLKDHNWTRAHAHFDELAAESHDSVCALIGRAFLALVDRSPHEVTTYFHRAAKSKPLSSAVRGLCSWGNYLARKYAAAQEQIVVARQTGRVGRFICTAEALTAIQRDSPSRAAEHIQRLLEEDPANLIVHAALGHTLARTGNRAKAQQVLDSLSQRGIPGASFHLYGMAIVLVGLGEHQRAVESLQDSFSVGSVWALGFPLDPILDPLRGTPVFEAFIQRSYPANSVGFQVAD